MRTRGRGARGGGLGARAACALRRRAACRSTVDGRDRLPVPRDARRSRSRPRAAVRFPLVLRVPAWAEGATVRVGGGAGAADDGRARSTASSASGAARRRWPCASRCGRRSRPATTRRSRSSAARSSTRWRSARQWTRVNADKPHRELPHGDFEVRPTTPWNYGLVARPGAARTASLRFEERPVGERPFSPEGAGMSADGARRGACPGWKLAHGWAGEISRADTAWAAPAPAGADGPARGGPARALRLHEHPHHGVPAARRVRLHEGTWRSRPLRPRRR